MKYNNQKRFHLFLDETGDHGLTYIDKSFPIFLLAGCLFDSVEYENIKYKMSEFKNDFFGTDEVILHSRDIRKCEGHFKILFDENVKKKFYKRLNQIISDTQFSIIAVAIDKKKHIEMYGKIAQDPYMLCLSYVLEQLVSRIQSDVTSTVEITIEKRGKKEDSVLLAHYNSVIDRGTLNVSSLVFKQKISGFSMRSKKDNDVGIQIADLCAYPIARHALNSDELYIPFILIKDKLIKSREHILQTNDIKIFP